MRNRVHFSKVLSSLRWQWMAGLLVLTLLLAACGAVAAPAPAEPTLSQPAPVQPTQVEPTPVQPTPVPQATAQPVLGLSYVEVENQAVTNGTVTIREVESAGPGWIVIHTQKDGGVGPVVGYAAVQDGESKDVVVTIDTTKATATLYAMLHTDAGTVGTYEFPGLDVPVKGDASEVNPSFTVTGLPTAPQAVAIDLANFSFSPAEITIKAGTTIVWTNKDRTTHTVTADDGLFDSGSLNQDGQFRFTFDTAGTYAYYCQPHGGPGGSGMAARIIVTP